MLKLLLHTKLILRGKFVNFACTNC